MKPMSTQEPALLTVRELKNTKPQEPVFFKGVFIIKKSTVRTARNGTEYLMVELADRAGAFTFNTFQDSNVFQICKNEGSIVMVEGQTDYYQERFSPKILDAKEISPEEAQKMGIMSLLIETCLEDPDALWDELQSYIQDMQHIQLQATVKNVLQKIEEDFRASAAAISMHHAYRHGLLEHTVHMARSAKALFPVYTEVNPDLALAGIILHDVGKALEYDTGLTIKKTRIGLLQGHVVLGYRLVRRAAIESGLSLELTERLEHIILSHQGELEWGAAVMASTPEAVFVSMVDNLDAKMGVVQYALRNAPMGKEFGDYSPALKASVLLNEVPS